jgi:hypothetical protein
MTSRLLSFSSNKQEDKQTASIFSTLLHLPDQLFWDILKDSCYNNILPQNIGIIEDFEFWPHWPPDEKHTNFVEPDLFIRFTDLDVIFESKRYDKNQQDSEQWNSEYNSYLKKYGNNKKVALIAVGGLNDSDLSPQLGEIIIQKCRWRSILDTLYQYKIKNIKFEHLRIINDCIKYLEYFSFSKIVWLKEMMKYNIAIKETYDLLNWLISYKFEREWSFFELKRNNIGINNEAIKFMLQWRAYVES